MMGGSSSGGGHANLLTRGGRYAEMWHRQQEATEDQAALERTGGAPRLTDKGPRSGEVRPRITIGTLRLLETKLFSPGRSRHLLGFETAFKGKSRGRVRQRLRPGLSPQAA